MDRSARRGRVEGLLLNGKSSGLQLLRDVVAGFGRAGSSGDARTDGDELADVRQGTCAAEAGSPLEGCAAHDAATMAARRPATPIRLSVLWVRDGRLAAMTYARASVGT